MTPGSIPSATPETARLLHIHICATYMCICIFMCPKLWRRTTRGCHNLTTFTFQFFCSQYLNSNLAEKKFTQRCGVMSFGLFLLPLCPSSPLPPCHLVNRCQHTSPVDSLPLSRTRIVEFYGYMRLYMRSEAFASLSAISNRQCISTNSQT